MNQKKKKSKIVNCYLFRSGLGSLRRGMGKTSTPELAGGQRKTKAVMIWKKGWKGWKKLHSFGNNSNKTGESFSFLYCIFQTYCLTINIKMLLRNIFNI